MSQQISVNQLKRLGFIYIDGDTIDDSGYYFEDYRLKVNDSRIDCTISFSDDKKELSRYYELNGVLLKGVELTLKHIQMLKKIL